MTSPDHTSPGDTKQGFSHPGLVILLGMILTGFVIVAVIIQFLPMSGLQDAIGGYAPLDLTPEEQQWIEEHPEVWVCPDQNYPPFEQITKSEDYQGISADLLREVAKSTGLHIRVSHENNWDNCIEKIKDGSADILGAVYISSLRDEYLIYSEPYYHSLLPIITRSNTRTDMTLDQLSGKRVASVGNFTTTLLLREQYPDITVIEVPDIKTGLRKVSLGTADAYFGDMAASTYYVESEGISNLHVAGTYQPQNADDFSYAFGVRKDSPELVGIINKGLRAIPSAKRDEIFRKWISPTMTRPPISPVLVMSVIGIVAILLLVTGMAMLWNRTLTRVVKEKTADLARELAEHKKTSDSLLITRFTVDHSHAMFLWVDNTGTIRDFNETLCKETGYSPQELFHKPLDVLDARLTGQALNELVTRVRNEGRIRLETDLTIRDGTTIPVEIVLWYFTYEGTEWFCAEMQNITERKEQECSIRENEEKYRDLFQNVNDAIVLFTFDEHLLPGRIIEVNGVASIMTGYSYKELCQMQYDSLGETTLPMMTDPDHHGFSTRLFRFEWALHTATGTTIPVEINLHVFERGGAFFGLSVIRDMTERYQFEVEREAAITQIQRNMAELSLLNDAIRNPLSVILGVAEIHTNEETTVIEDQVRKIDGMINQLDRRWMESEKILNFLKKHYGMVISLDEQNRDQNR
ncbi:MAG: transporter substrate-binding domain-containing protein [Methanospirillum sp.]|uniref:PAS domain S-box protein n=1 Tax=Methanospirillum sp. TaxID=45200 RepID=UPI002372D48C|nr:transporter substrate-binding domain-containing protein [Methanospirillum sp.]MDD1728523.1 transporter substrate-binding domain-containing protein [Methanospirillum sp.]